MSYAEQHMKEAVEIIRKMDVAAIEKMVDLLAKVKADAGRIFFLGVGGSAGNCSHAVNDFRKIVGIESYAPTDNVSELTARTNDEGWDTVFVEWLKVSKLQDKDVLFILSVGGGNLVGDGGQELEREPGPNSNTTTTRTLSTAHTPSTLHNTHQRINQMPVYASWLQG